MLNNGIKGVDFMKRKGLMKVFYLSLITTMSIGTIASAKPMAKTFENTNLSQIEVNGSIYNQLKGLEEKYGVKITQTKEIYQKDIPLIEKSIQDGINGLDELKAKVSVPEKVEFNSLTRVSQDYRGTTYVDATLPNIGLYRVYIPYSYTVVQAGGNPPYFANASTGVTYGLGVAIGAYAHQESWAEIISNGRPNNILELNAKGSIVYSVGITQITLPNQVFLKTFYL